MTGFKIGSASLLPFARAAMMLAALTACSSSAKPIGSTIKGTRIAVLEQSKKTVSADKDLEGTKPQLPAVFDNAAWPQAGYDTTHVMPNAALADHPREAWRVDIGNGSDSDFKLLARPVVSHDRIFVMDSHGRVSAFATKDGKELWSFETTVQDLDDTIGGGLGIDGDTVYATTGFGEVLALVADTGKVRWRHSLMKPIRAAPTIADGRVYAVSIDNELSALDAGTGDVLWHHNGISESATLMGASSPAVTGDGVIVAYSSGEIYDLRAENGRVSWNYGLTLPTQVGALPAIADIRGLPVIDRDRIYAVSHSGRIAAVDHRTGDRAWEADIGGINTPVAGGDTVFVLSNDAQIVALTRESGRVLWVHELQRHADAGDKESDPVSWTGPVLANNKLWLVNSLGQLVSFSPDDGSSMDMIDLENPCYITPIVADKTIYVVTDNGQLVALR